MRDPNRTGGPKNQALIFRYDTVEEWVCKLPDRLADPLLRALERVRVPVCRIWGGHHPINDQCHRPEHRYCVFCQKPTPYAAVAPGE